MTWATANQERRVSIGSTLALCFLLAPACGDDANSNRKVTTPLLNDEEIVKKYVAEFPVDDYDIFEVESVGQFYLRKNEKAETQPKVVDLVKSTIRRGEVWEKSLHLTMKALAEPGTVAIDVGAHIGAHTVVLSKLLGPDGKVYAFEPQMERYRHLCKNLELNDCRNTIPLRYAVGDKHDVIEISREKVSDLGSGGERAELRTLDSFELDKVSLIKIDVEGYEDNVIDGAKETIRRNRPLVLVEIRGGINPQLASPEQQRQIDHTISKLEAFDYKVVNIGGHDYLAVPTERKREVDRALRKELGQPTVWERFGLSITILVVGSLLALNVVARSYRQRKPKQGS